MVYQYRRLGFPWWWQRDQMLEISLLRKVVILQFRTCWCNFCLVRFFEHVFRNRLIHCFEPIPVTLIPRFVKKVEKLGLDPPGKVMRLNTVLSMVLEWQYYKLVCNLDKLPSNWNLFCHFIYLESRSWIKNFQIRHNC